MKLVIEQRRAGQDSVTEKRKLRRQRGEFCGRPAVGATLPLVPGRLFQKY